MHQETPLLPNAERPRYFVVNSRGDGSIREWNPPHWDPSWPQDCRYYGQVFRHMERFIDVPRLRFYITWDPDQVPEYGPNIVTLLLGDEWAKTPRYGRYVNTVIRTLDSNPRLGIRRWFPLDAMRRNLLLKYARNLFIHYRARRREARARFQIAPVVNRIHLLHTPLGTSMLDDLPVKPMRERAYHCFFAGQFETNPPRGLDALKESPKQIARRAMVKEMLALQKRDPRLRLDLTITGATHDGPHTGDNRSYSERMMDSKICLAPRGSMVDTWRFFEGLKSGCLVVCEPLPDHYFYRGAPVIQIDSWDELERVITPFLDDDDALQEWSSRSLQYWRDVCGEEAIGRRVAEFIADSPASHQLHDVASLNI